MNRLNVCDKEFYITHAVVLACDKRLLIKDNTKHQLVLPTIDTQYNNLVRICNTRRSVWPCGLRRRSEAFWFLDRGFEFR
jgi:hypothetical protein